MRIKTTLLAVISACIVLVACGNTSAEVSGEVSDEVSSAPVAAFSPDSAYQFVKAQCDMGPRVPGTQAHSRCAGWLEQRLKDYCDTVVVQHGDVTTFDGKSLNISNIVGIFNPDAKRRLLLLAHWDCRPWATNDPDESKRTQPVMGANDAASGVAVLLELARNLKQTRPEVGVDILLVDAEDWGEDGGDEDSWALGTQYWAAHPHVEGYSAEAGILLDMVGARGAVFPKEIFSLQYASGLVGDVWSTARSLGYGQRFIDSQGGAITDDHVTINRKAGIPCIDIIDMRMGSDTGFFEFWHTTGDTLDKIDSATLGVVGRTLAKIIAEF